MDTTGAQKPSALHTSSAAQHLNDNVSGHSSHTKSKPHLKWWKSKRASRVGLVLLALTIVGFLVWLFAIHPYVSTDDSRVAMTFVKVAPSGVGGRIETVNVTEGTKVKAGDILVEIDHRISQANFDRAKSKFDLAERELARMERLTKEGSATPQSLDQARATAAAAKTELASAEVALENTYLKSPFDGVVVQKVAEVGNLLEPGQTAVVVADEEHAWIAANIEETSVGLVKVGQPVHITVDEGGELNGTVSEIRASVASQFALIPSDSGAGNFTKVVQRVPIKIALSDRKGINLRAGQSVEIRVRVH